MSRPALGLFLAMSACAHVPLRDAKFELPPGESRAAVLRDAEALVDSEDPVLRDDVGSGLVVAWVCRPGGGAGSPERVAVRDRRVNRSSPSR